MTAKKVSLIAIIALILSAMLAACAPAAAPATEAPAEEPAEEPMEEEMTEEPMVELEGDVVADGSSTVYPITVAVAEEFQALHPDVRVSVGLSGTGGGFEKFCNGETDISDASRPIKDEEAQICADAGIEWTEFLVALDGLTVMVHPFNDFVECLNPTQVTEMLKVDSPVVNWSDVDPAWPAEPISFFIPDPDSGTRDYMTEIVEEFVEAEDQRGDENTTVSSDDNILLDGIANNDFAFGYFGFAYYINNADAVKAVAIENEAGDCVLPSDETVRDGSYNPLSRPLFIYVNNASVQEKPQVAEYVRYYLAEGANLVMGDVGYSLPPEGTFEEDLEVLAGILGE